MLMEYNDYFLINLNNYFNNDGISYDYLKCDGAFDGNGCTYPGEELPDSNALVFIDDIPFLFPSKENGYRNNMLIRKQEILLKENKYDYLYVLGACEGAYGESFEEEVVLMNNNECVDSVYIGLSNWLSFPIFYEKIAFVCSHLHYPDFGQFINRNMFTKKEYLNYNVGIKPQKYISKEFAYSDLSTLAKDDWKPKLWLQSARLPKWFNIDRVKFKNENLNFHIFAMTFRNS